MALFFGFYLGVLSMTIMYNLHWYFVTKERSFLHYVGYKTLMLLAVIQGAQVVFISTLLLDVTLLFLMLLLTSFLKSFLALDDFLPKVSRLISYIQFFIILYFLVCLSIGYEDMFTLPYSLIFSPIILVGIFISRKGFKPALYFSIGWGLSLTLTGFSDANAYNIINFYPEFRFDLVGHILESVILTYAIFAKTRFIYAQKEQQEKLLIHQAKLAAMGKMLENISHQWRQPLNRIATFIINMKMSIADKTLEEEYINDLLDQSQCQLDYMSNTINDFTDFNQQDNTKEEFFATAAVDNVYSIIKSTLEQNNTTFTVNVINDFTIYSYPNELGQVLLNLIQNANDELVSRSIENPKITLVE